MFSFGQSFSLKVASYDIRDKCLPNTISILLKRCLFKTLTLYVSGQLRRSRSMVKKLLSPGVPPLQAIKTIQSSQKYMNLMRI